VRASAVAVLVVIAAVLGGISTLLVGRAAGLVAPERSQTIVVAPDAVETAERPPASTVPPVLRGTGFDPSRIFEVRSPGVVTIFAHFSVHEGASSQGSGFVVSPAGYVLTNSHVITTASLAESGEDVAAAERVYVEFSDRDRIPARIVGYDLFNDVGVLKVDPGAHPLTPIPLGDSTRAVVGEPVAAIGSPFGNENSLAIGIVSAHRAIASLTSRYTITDAIQTDAPINQGNSGGPLLDARGRAIGINAQIRSESGLNEGVGFAVPINTARRSMRQLIRSGRVRYAYVGVTTDDVTPTRAQRFDLTATSGAIITQVLPNSGADRAGLRGGKSEEEFNGTRFTVGGDVIVAIGGRVVHTSDDVARIVTERYAPGDTVVFTIVREHRRLRVSVRLGERPLRPSD
jgi:2-alkenal reductase